MGNRNNNVPRLLVLRRVLVGLAILWSVMFLVTVFGLPYWRTPAVYGSAAAICCLAIVLLNRKIQRKN